MATVRTAHDCALVREAAEAIVRVEYDSFAPSFRREYRHMARGILAALDWVEGRRALGPSTGTRRLPDDRGQGVEMMTADDYVTNGRPDPLHEVRSYHDGVWSLLAWLCGHTDLLAINVPGLAA